MNFEHVPISTLKPLAKNARKHSKRNIDVIKKSLEECGQQKPIVVNASDVVIAGNGTLQAAQELGWEKIWIARTALDQNRAELFAILDNRTAELAEWDVLELEESLASLEMQGWDLEKFGWDRKEKEEAIKEKELDENIPTTQECPNCGYKW